MTEKQKHQARVLEYFPFEKGSPNARFVQQMANYARYEPGTELTNHDAKNLERLFNAYVRDTQTARQS